MTLRKSILHNIRKVLGAPWRWLNEPWGYIPLHEKTKTPQGIIMIKESNHRIKEATEQMRADADILASDILNLLDKKHPNVGTITQALGIVMDKMQLMVFRVQDVLPSQSPQTGQKVTE